MIECLLAEDQTLVRLGLKNLLELDGELVVTHCAENGAACIELLEQYQFDIVLLDMRMPEKTGIDVLQAMKKYKNKTPVLIITTFEDCDVLVRAMNLGARGYILKNAELECLVEAIKKVHIGQQVLQPTLTQYLLSQNYDKAEQLTDKEYEVLKCLSLGLSNKAIAETLNNSEGTIRNHVSQIIAKLNVKDRTQAVIKAINEHLI
ncbi:two-component system, NarL family, nitrate/nitrite response regulator NarP [Pseudoalteromonas citrea]|uniref:Two-component system, NarL family, nitrate/nitrite response regulator NarP n=2 Tax=Pseudoalteromonas citrea TaxID=43655 RepID=A0AAD4AG09_9GAMM|nr:response regulator transcription factor [Pseudoalteromonas citrea]KAF7767555.1 two-component system, NarL family, nitrate/nitrite response regulator NarP [Pseudoalteromonas citrea]